MNHINRPSFALLSLAPLPLLTLCVMLAALAAYPLHFVLPESIGFRSLVSRGALLIIFISLFPLAKMLRLSFADMGLSLSRRRFGGQLMRGFGLGVLMLGLHVWALLALDVRLINEDKILTATRILGVLVKSALAGLLIALIEEALFRGLLMGSLARGISLINAAIISSMYFALLHFFKSDLKPGFDNIHWDSGLLILSDAFSNLAEINPDAFFALFYAGLFLSCVRLIIPQGLGYCIGIHAGWVFVIKSAKTLSYVDEQSELNWLVSSYDGMIGNLSTAWISMACLWLIWRYQKNKAQQGVALTCQTEAQL